MSKFSDFTKTMPTKLAPCPTTGCCHLAPATVC